MKFNIKEGQGFILFTATEGGTVRVDYGFDVSNLRDAVESNDEDYQSSAASIAALVASLASQCQNEMYELIADGAQMIEDGFFEVDEDSEGMYAKQVLLPNADDYDLSNMEPEGNA